MKNKQTKIMAVGVIFVALLLFGLTELHSLGETEYEYPPRDHEMIYSKSESARQKRAESTLEESVANSSSVDEETTTQSSKDLSLSATPKATQTELALEVAEPEKAQVTPVVATKSQPETFTQTPEVVEAKPVAETKVESKRQLDEVKPEPTVMLVQLAADEQKVAEVLEPEATVDSRILMSKLQVVNELEPSEAMPATPAERGSELQQVESGS